MGWFGRARQARRGWALLAVTLLVPVSIATRADAGGTETEAGQAAGTRPNVLLVITDDQPSSLFSRELMPETFRRLVDRGARFDRAYVGTSLCCPSRAQILTGLRGHHTGVDVNSTPLRRPTIVQGLQSAGYRTLLAGKYLNSMPCGRPAGFDRWACVGPGLAGYTMVDPMTNVDGVWQQLRGHSTDLQADFLAAAVADTPTGVPFFAVYAPTSPHLPADDPRCATLPVTFEPSASYDAETRDGAGPAWLRRPPLSADERAQIEDEYLRMARAVRCLDGSIARLLDGLGERAADTAVVLVSDNGYLYGEHRRYTKGVPYEEAVRVPLVVRYPGWISERVPLRTAALAENVDIAATVADIAGIPWGGDGVSLGPVVRRERLGVRDEVLLQHCQGVTAPCPWTSLQFVNDVQLAVAGHWGIVTDSHKYLEYDTGERQLFDLVLDPTERTNRAADPGYALVRSQLAGRLAALRAPPAPETTIATGPTGLLSSRAASFSYFTQSRAASYRCRLDRDGLAGAWSACNGGTVELNGLADGSYVFSVAGAGADGVADRTPATRAFQVRSSGPAVAITGAPPPDAPTRDVAVSFGSTAPAPTFQCRFALATHGNPSWVSCASPFRRTGLADGEYRFEVRAVVDGVTSAPPAQVQFRIDATGPAMVLDAGPRQLATADRSSRLVFHPDEATVGAVTCRLDGGLAIDCSDGVHTASELADGPHVLTVTALDRAGMSTTTSFGWVVDTVDPVIQFTSGPPDGASSGDAVFNVAASETMDGLFCRLDAAHAFSPCPKPLAYAGLAPGDHVLVAVVKDRARNFSAPVTWAWRQDAGGEVPGPG